jgi:hypothetical protein
MDPYLEIEVTPLYSRDGMASQGKSVRIVDEEKPGGWKEIGVVSANYLLVHNTRLKTVVDEIAGRSPVADWKQRKAFFDGKRFVYALTSDSILAEVTPGDLVRFGLIGYNSYDGSRAVSVGMYAELSFSPQMIQRQGGAIYDIRSIRVKVSLGDTEASDIHSLVFSFSREVRIVSVRAVLQNLDYDAVLSRGKTLQDTLTLRRIVDFLEQFRIAYNTKNITFLEQVYSDDALIIVGTVLKRKEGSDDLLKGTLLTRAKVKLIQLTKQQYIEGLRNRAFKSSAFLNVRFDDIQIIQHEKIPYIYGISCQQEWKSSSYSDRGYLFLMMDFRNEAEPVIHVRTWQPQPFEDGTYVGLYDFDVVQYKQ